MSKYIKPGDKLGYLNPKTGRYFFVEIVSMKESELIMLQIQKVGKKKIDNIYTEQTANVLKCLKEDSKDFKDGRKLMKHKSVNHNYMTEPLTRYYTILNKN